MLINRANKNLLHLLCLILKTSFMSNNHHAEIEEFMDRVRSKNGHEPEFLQAVQEVAEAVIPFMESHPKYKTAKILDRIVEPERTIIFRIPWLDDNGNIQVNRV